VVTQPAPPKPEAAKVEPPPIEPPKIEPSKPEPVKIEPPIAQQPLPGEPPKPIAEPPKPEPVRKPSPFPAPPQPTTPKPGPQLTQILSAEQKQAYNQSIDASVARARRALASLGGRTLTADQRATVDRVRTFLSQAEDARKQDLVRAKGLADRADLLAQDLLKSVM
jgi:hypothetical protein